MSFLMWGERTMAEELCPSERRVAGAIDGDIPLTSDPFGAIARETGLSRDQVLESMRSLRRKGVLRRVAAVLHHRRSGYTANGMLVCRVPEPELERLGCRLAELESVSHCYRRRSYPGWPYNLYAMIHAGSREEVERMVGVFTAEAGIDTYKILYSTWEIKKTSVRVGNLFRE